MRVLLIASVKDVFGKELKSELSSNNVNVSLLDFESLIFYDNEELEINTYRNIFEKFKSIPKLSMVFRMFFIKKLITENKFDVVNIHVSRWFYIAILPWLVKQKLVITIYGSDFYRASKFEKKMQSFFYKKADILTFTNPLTQKSFNDFYKKFESKTYVCRFGLKTLSFIDKNKNVEKKTIKKLMGFNVDKIIITCGYNSTKEQQHESIIKSILDLSKDVINKSQFIFPLTYGDDKNKEKIKNILYKTDLDYKILEDFLFDEDNANLKLASDIMINVLKTDSFSGSMQEFIYANNIVITGSWLPYQVLDIVGVKYMKVDYIQELSNQLEMVVNSDFSLLDCSGNKEKIYHLSSWESNIVSWISIYEN